ncbi:type I-E CRISPR-associated protein Cse1/CasA [Enterobacter sp.]|uniref:type I-E CRISPR-associated protein Cse1/CasA n=1 Tax=Enterobacter sp. TaxID=42895 RepID=UPI00296FB679|nr:type I-E CRISPR-associated protein Cse1/CasA [Enterobacter sp.]
MDKFSLLTTPWLPVQFRDGTRGKLAPVNLADENVVALTAPRADLQGAAWQFLLGLLQSTLASKDIEAWQDIWHEGLNPDAVRAGLEPLEHAFQFGPQTPSFMQDFSPLSGEYVSIATLLPETPGAQAIKFNKDHFVKRGVTEKFCPHCAALALFALQLNAPAGGKGFRTGLRGGGPMTTLIELQTFRGETQPPLWRKLWLNVMPQESASLPLPQQYDADVFPWLAETRTSEQANAITTPSQVNALQAYWGMPRRIRLNFDRLSSGSCDLCGAHSEALLSEMTTKNYGVNYVGWVHPLTAHRRPIKEGGEIFSVKGQPGGLFWRDWLGLNANGTGENNHEYPAKVVELFPSLRLRDVTTGLWAFGYDFDNMKARNWYEHHFPLLLASRHDRDELISLLRQAAQSASRTLGLLRSALKEAWFGAGAPVRGDLSFIDIDFWQRTQTRFLALVKDIEEGQDSEKRLKAWQGEMFHFARNDFDRRAFTCPEGKSDLGRIMEARKKFFTVSDKKQNGKAERAKKQQEKN